MDEQWCFCQPKHKQVPIAWQGLEAEVDVGLAPLILALWRAGIVTRDSCQDDAQGCAYIEFSCAGSAKRFLDRVAVYPDESELPTAETLYGRITGCGSDDDWRSTFYVENWGVDEDMVNGEVVTTRVGPSNFQFPVLIRFPRTDIPLILARFEDRPKPA